MNEAGVWKYLRRGMEPYWDAVRIESSSGNGIPDVNYAMAVSEGWIEIKYVPHWPKRDTTRIPLELRDEQKIYFIRRLKLKRNVFAFCRIENDFFLLTGEQALEAAEGEWTKSDWMKKPELCWSGRVDFEGLYRRLASGLYIQK